MDRSSIYAVIIALGLVGMLAATPRPVGKPTGYSLVPAWPHLEFSKPLDLEFLKDGDALLIEKKGTIRRLPSNRQARSAPVVCDLQKRVSTAANEMGLLGLAVDPKSNDGSHLYINYTANNPRRTIIARIEDLSPQRHTSLLEIRQPYGNHNGGCLRFGPDGMLYIGMGDGGGAGDPKGNGQNRKTLLAAMLRIDVSCREGDRAYAIPTDNPLAGNDKDLREELWAWGLRNPWRFSFDATTGHLWAGDVGQNEFEEVTLVPKGANCGWNIKEGFSDYDSEAVASTSPLTAPLHSYPLTEGKSIVGGFVYRGRAHPDLVGTYLFADFFSGKVWSLKTNNSRSSATLLVDSAVLITSINADVEGEPLFLGYRGTIFKLNRQAGPSLSR